MLLFNIMTTVATTFMEPTPDLRAGLQPTDPIGARPGDISPELVRQVADRVWALLRADLQLEQERRRRMNEEEYYG
jgi:hypothetical protein